RNSIDTVTFLLSHRKFDIFALTETWLSDTDSDAFLLSGARDYFVFCTDRVDSRGGGVLIYAHSTTLPVQVSSLVIPGFECSTIDIFSNVATNATNCIRIITIYRAPNSPLSSTSLFIDYLNLSTSCPHPYASVKPTRNYNFANWDLINRGIAIHDWTIALSNKTATEAYSYFSNFINSLLDAFVPLKTPKTNSGYPKHLGLLHDRIKIFHNIVPNCASTHSLRERFNRALKKFEFKLFKINGSLDNIPNFVYTKCKFSIVSPLSLIFCISPSSCVAPS
ncbi:hypothetical protein PENTCL1PPCAC_26868, partial [Pristionchus entomophagus]